MWKDERESSLVLCSIMCQKKHGEGSLLGQSCRNQREFDNTSVGTCLSVGQVRRVIVVFNSRTTPNRSSISLSAYQTDADILYKAPRIVHHWLVCILLAALYLGIPCLANICIPNQQVSVFSHFVCSNSPSSHFFPLGNDTVFMI